LAFLALLIIVVFLSGPAAFFVKSRDALRLQHWKLGTESVTVICKSACGLDVRLRGLELKLGIEPDVPLLLRRQVKPRTNRPNQTPFSR